MFANSSEPGAGRQHLGAVSTVIATTVALVGIFILKSFLMTPTLNYTKESAVQKNVSQLSPAGTAESVER